MRCFSVHYLKIDSPLTLFCFCGFCVTDVLGPWSVRLRSVWLCPALGFHTFSRYLVPYLSSLSYVCPVSCAVWAVSFVRLAYVQSVSSYVQAMSSLCLRASRPCPVLSMRCLRASQSCLALSRPRFRTSRLPSRASSPFSVLSSLISCTSQILYQCLGPSPHDISFIKPSFSSPIIQAVVSRLFGHMV